jgi:hypothetical protein
MFYAAEQEKRLLAELAILRSEKAGEANLCRYKSVSCIRCCLPHIGGDSHREGSEETRLAPHNADSLAHHDKYSDRYLGPGGIVVKFRNFNPLKDPKIEASQYEDSLPDVGKKEMERRFAERRKLFLEFYDPAQPRQSLPRYMDAAQRNEEYRYTPAASAGLISLFLGGTVPKKPLQKGELPECQLLGFVDGKRTVGCMAHPQAETSQGYDGRDHVGFFHHTGCCRNIGCEASEEFKFLSASALKIFDRTINGMSWYQYSRHATSVLVYYLRGYDHLMQKFDQQGLLDALTLERLAVFTNSLFDNWPLKKPDFSEHHSRESDPVLMNNLDILSTSIPLAERILYLALDTGFLQHRFPIQLQHARSHINKRVEAVRSE